MMKRITPRQFKARLTQLGLTQVAFAKHIGKHERTVSRWMRGNSPVPSWVVLQLDSMQRSK